MNTAKNPQTALAACVFALTANQGDSLQLFPSGEFTAPDGALLGDGPWHLDKALADKLIGAVSGLDDLLIDYDHQSLLFTQNKQALAAAGTFPGSGLQWDDKKGLFATGVQWTAAAKAKINSGDYRFISPLFTYDNTGAVTQLISIAVTNNPAIKHMQAIELAAASFLNPPEKKTMNKKLISLLGLAESANEAVILAACTALKTASSIPPDLLAALSLDDKAKPDDVLTAVKTLQEDKDKLAAASNQPPDTKNFVPIAAVTELQTQLAALSATVEGDKVTELINANIRKLPTPGLQQWAATQDLAALSKYLETAPEIAALSEMQTGGNAPEGSPDKQADIIAAATKYKHEQEQAGNMISVAAAVSYVTKNTGK